MLGFGEDRRVRDMFEWLVRTQLPDGGWNCEPGAGKRSVPQFLHVHGRTVMGVFRPAVSEMAEGGKGSCGAGV